ncbi:MAG: tetratricopeptide repeat protein [Treponema sp.]|jgi:Flp pilus assembly protein TadD|nr:tetratricopeptide repeat protein [Treponema sp.]
MKKPFIIAILLILLPALCWAGGKKDNQQPVLQPQQTTTLFQPPPSPIFWLGDGGKGIRLAVLEPTGKGLSATEQWIPSMVQGSITGDFQKFSAMTIIDRQNLEKILSEQKQSVSGDYSDDNYISIGKLTNTRYILGGSITKTANVYMLELAVTDVETGERKASYPPKTVSLLALENQSAIKEATVELLEQLGVNLTERGRQELGKVVNTAQAQAETALARGINAQRQGTVVEALSYFIQASNYDSGLVEAANRMNALTANISSGNIGEDARNEIAWRRQWVARLQETETFFANTIKEPQPFYIVYSTNIQRGKIDWQKEIIELSVRMGFYPDFAWSNQINGVVTAVKSGLQATKRAQIWELDWPAKTINAPSPFISQTKNLTSTVIVEIINDDGKSIGRQTVKAPYGFESIDYVVTPIWQWEGTVIFPTVDTNLITDKLTIKITSIDGIAAETAARQKRISVLSESDWETLLRLNPTIKQNIEAARRRQGSVERAIELVKQADEHYKKGNFVRAIKDYDEAIGINPNNAEGFNGRGNAYSRIGGLAMAIRDFERALQINPNSAEAKQNIERIRQLQEQVQRAQALFDSGNYNQAIYGFTEAIRLNPYDAYLYNSRGVAYERIGNYVRARADYEAALQIKPDSKLIKDNLDLLRGK